jgi:arylsulfatase A-like enzyme
MMSRTTFADVARATDSASQDLGATRLGVFPLIVLSAWCGLLSGLLEIGVVLLRKRTYDYNHLYWMSRHFVWLIPLITLTIFLAVGMALSVMVLCWRGRGNWLAPRALGALTLLPPIWAVSPRIYGLAGFLLAVGIAMRLVPAIGHRAAGFRRLLRFSFPFFAGIVPIVALSLWGIERQKARREEARPLPPPGSPNVLLIVMDTVGAAHLSLQGYNRPTSPTIDELAAKGIRFDRAQAAASWTLMSHSSMFTGRWPHELSSGWFTPLDGAYPTLAEFLGSHGYATAGFIANYWYCASDSGLDRGFAAYQDYIFPRLTAFKSTVLVDRTLDGVQSAERFLEDWLDFDLLKPTVDYLGWLFKSNRKDAAVVNKEFLDWLSRRRQPARPFFAFLNFYDVHFPYEIPPTGTRRFGVKPRNRRETTMMRDWPRLMQNGPSQSQIAFGRDAYDDCLADLDERLGQLIDELERRSVLDTTWVVITGDHGESFGENHGVFWHGTSLYQAQLHVPLVIIPPAQGISPRVVSQTVSLKDLAATTVDLLGVKTGSPFPGNSLARFWRESTAGRGPAVAGASDPVLSEVVPLDSFGADPSQFLTKQRWPLAALTEGDFTYIRREGELREELFRGRDSIDESRNLADQPAMQPILERLRKALTELTAGPLTPRRFNP